MAQGHVASMPLATMAVSANAKGASSDVLTEDELHQIKEFERIIRFRDQVLSGEHPRIKVPAHLVAARTASSSSEARAVPSPATTAVRSDALDITMPSSSTPPTAATSDGIHAVENVQSFQANAQRPPVAVLANLPGLGTFSNNSVIPGMMTSSSSTAPSKHLAKQFGSGSGKVEINPVLLEKSDDLIKAEIQLQRQRLERALREQLEQQRAATKSLHASEPLADFDLKEVLTKALELVQKTAAPPTTDANLAANPSGAESDSFDENTFYSSQHDTPDSHQLSRLPNESEDAEMLEDSQYEPQLESAAAPASREAHIAAVPPAPAPVPSTDPNMPAAHVQQPKPAVASQAFPLSSDIPAYSSTAIASRAGVPLQAISSEESGEASRSGESGNTDNEHISDQQRLEVLNRELLNEAFGRQESPILRAHNLSPIAPQPAHVSPLAVARQPPGTGQVTGIPRGTPAQVAALRKNLSNASSPESSPQGRPNKKTKKNKKRKADRSAGDAGASPYIKPEPRSPSPLSAPQFTRPQKRQRQSQRPAQALNYDEPQYEVRPDERYLEPSQQMIYRGERAPVVYERPDGYYARHETRPIIVSEAPRYEREYLDDRPPMEAQYVQRSQSRDAYSIQYAPTEVRSVRALSQAVVGTDRPYRDAPVYYRDFPERSAATHRQIPDRNRSRSPVMGPPRAPVTRIIVDEFGREYIEPPRPTTNIVQQPVAPTARPGDPEIVYERAAPVRAASRIPGPEVYQEERVIYRPASPAYAAPRRVVTQPEYANPEYRAYRQREYSARPPVEGYVQSRSAADPRPLEAPPREFITRATSVLPAEPVRYEIPRGIRYQSVRPEPAARDYASAVYPETRRGVLQPSLPLEYSVRPTEAPQIIRREYSVRPVEQPFFERPERGAEEVTYIERPRAAPHETAYNDGVQRDVYQ